MFKPPRFSVVVVGVSLLGCGVSTGAETAASGVAGMRAEGSTDRAHAGEKSAAPDAGLTAPDAAAVSGGAAAPEAGMRSLDASAPGAAAASDSAASAAPSDAAAVSDAESVAAPASTSDAASAADAASASGAALERTPKVQSQPLAALAGVYATPPSDQPGLRVSTDLGWTFAHRDKLWTLFGDSWLLDRPTLSGPNDALGYMSLTDFPSGASVEAYIAAHPARAGEPAWRAAAPPLHYVQQGGRGFAPMTIERDGMVVPTGNGYTPMTGFSNGRDDERAGAFTIVYRYGPIECESGSCRDGYFCDQGLGHDRSSEYNRVCVVGESAYCVSGPGYCQDRGITRYNDSSSGRTESVVVRHDVGLMNEADPAHFSSQGWETRRFFNLTSRTITDFDPARAGGEGNDYRPAQGNDLPRSGLFVWGRSHFGGIGADGRDAQLYLAWVPMPEVAADAQFAWQPRYFAGLDEAGTPRFVERELDATPLDLDAATSGEQPQEQHDIVSQMAVSWLPSVKRFVMFYGGDLPPEFANAVFNTDVGKEQHDPQGSLFMRYAEQPWGPWTAPQPLLAAGDVSTAAAAEGLYAPGGILAHNRCTAASCARYEPIFRVVPDNNNGVLYAPNIVDNWTAEHAQGIDLYWFVSTWNPYQVVLMKSTLTEF